MKILVVSDIHGRKSSALFIKNLDDKNNYDKIILLGDILYHGPRNVIPEDYDVKAVFNTLNLLKDKIIAIKGNCDSEVDEMVLEFKLQEKYYLYQNNKYISFTHGHKLNFNYKDNFIGLNILYGHYHIPSINIHDNRKYINVGSISLPKEDSKRSFAEIIDDEINIYDIDYTLIYKDNLI